MKKPVLIIAIILSFPAINFAQESKWSGKDRSDFIGECVPAAKAGMSTDSAKYYCYCMLDKMETRYPDPEDAGKVDETVLQTPEWKKLIQSCLGGYWTKSERSDFMSSCIDAAKANLGVAKAETYCDCMMYKIEIRFSDFEEASKLTAEILSTPEWKKII